LVVRIREVHAANYYAYGYRRVWKALRRAGVQVPRCRVQRLMKSHGIQGAKRRGKPWRTTKPHPQAARRPDLVERDFSATRTERALDRKQEAWHQRHDRGSGVVGGPDREASGARGDDRS
jgi:hypothetical protein